MPSPLLSTKLYVPRPRSNSITRRRLIELLDRPAGGGLTLISAPAGFGKTTLVSDWLANRQHRAGWLSLEEGDNDPVRFWRYVVLALQQVDGAIGSEASSLLEAGAQEPGPLQPEVFVAALVNELAAQALPIYVILDDYHLVSQADIHRGLSFLIDHLPPQVQIIMTCRADPPLPLARWRAGQILLELRAEDLRFTQEETAQFLNQSMGLQLTAGDITALAGKTEGWIVGLQLAALSLHGLQAEQQHQFIEALTGSHRYILDYLVEEVINRQSPYLQSFLLQTSILNRLCADLCAAVWQPAPRTPTQQRADAAQVEAADLPGILAYLERSNLFLFPLDQERKWFRYHRLYAEVLRHRLQQEFPDSLAALHLRAARWYEQHGFLAEAMEHALAANDHDRAAHLLEISYGEMIAHGQTATLHQRLSRLPEAIIRSRPRLCLAEAWTLASRAQLRQAEAQVAHAEALIAQAARGTDAAAQNHLRGEAAALRTTMAVIQDNPARILEHSRQALSYLPEQQRMLRGMIGVYQSVAHNLAGDLPAAREVALQVLDSGQQLNNRMLIYWASCNLAGVELNEGHLPRSAERLQQALQSAKTPGGAYLPMAAFAHRMLAELFYEWNELSRALHHGQQSKKLGKNWWVRDERIRSCMILLQTHLARGKERQARQALRQAEKMMVIDYVPTVLARVAVDHLRRWRQQGHFKIAFDWRDSREAKPPEQVTSGYQQQYGMLVMSRLCLAADKPELAARWLAPLLAERSGLVPTLIQIDAQVLLALIRQARDDQGAALQALQKALSMANGHGYVRTFIDEGEAMEALLRRVSGQFRPYAARLLGAIHGEKQQKAMPASTGGAATAMPAESLIEPLSRRELELLPLLDRGLANKEIAKKLHISVDTVKSHLKAIYGKLGVSSRTQAVSRARELLLL